MPNGSLETRVKELPVGDPGELIVISEEAGLIADTPTLGDVAAGDGEAVTELDGVDVQPGSADSLVVDEDLAGVGDAGADDLLIALDEAGGDGEGPCFGERSAKESLAGGAEAVKS